MIILAIETSTTQGSVALLRDGDCLLAKTFTSERSHNSQIFGPLGEALEITKPDLVVAGTGPGSYTGARIGIAAGIGISLTHGAKLIGLPSVIAADVAAPESTYHLIGDARRSSYFYAEVTDRQLARAPELISKDALAELLENEFHFITFDPKPPAEGIGVTNPTAQILAGIASTLTEAEINKLAAAPVTPHYMSAPFVTPPKKKREHEVKPERG
ncbi:MAG: tRNA threonylcarbamoyladenosine biosynthesis protein TsaB [Pseudoalteromonas tetraodonis]|jgi:tRNA threonylcarbamoyladenosine biosynthesis protein TsaB